MEGELMARDWIDERLMVLRIILAALLVSLGIYVLVAYVVVISGEHTPPGDDPYIKFILAGMGLMAAVISFVAKSIFLSERNLVRSGGSLMKPPDSSIDPDHFSIFSTFFTAHVMALALSESIGIFGLVIMFLTGDTTFFLGLIIFSALVMASHFPRKTKLQDIIRNYDMKRAMGMAEPIS